MFVQEINENDLYHAVAVESVDVSDVNKKISIHIISSRRYCKRTPQLYFLCKLIVSVFSEASMLFYFQKQVKYS